MKQRTLYEEAEHHNCVFVGTDKNGVPGHCHKRSTLSGFKQTIAGSQAEFSFHYNGNDSTVYVFEAPIDMLAYISMHKENWQKHSYVALCSVSERALLYQLKTHPQLQNIVLCLDNDAAGQEGNIRIQKRLKERPLQMTIDLKPALDFQQLDARILREFELGKNKQLKNILGALYPAKMVPVMMERAQISPEKPVRDITKEERQRLAGLTKSFPLTITSLRDYNEAIITRGGVNVREIQPSTMESRLVKGLFFAGEVLDLDAVTGGDNLQIAWCTGYAAGMGVRAVRE